MTKEDRAKLKSKVMDMIEQEVMDWIISQGGQVDKIVDVDLNHSKFTVLTPQLSAHSNRAVAQSQVPFLRAGVHYNALLEMRGEFKPGLSFNS